MTVDIERFKQLQCLITLVFLRMYSYIYLHIFTSLQILEYMY